MQTHDPLALTKSQLNARNDKRAASLFARRRDIDKRADDKRLAEQIKEFWQ